MTYQLFTSFNFPGFGSVELASTSYQEYFHETLVFLASIGTWYWRARWFFKEQCTCKLGLSPMTTGCRSFPSTGSALIILWMHDGRCSTILCSCTQEYLTKGLLGSSCCCSLFKKPTTASWPPNLGIHTISRHATRVRGRSWHHFQ